MATKKSSRWIKADGREIAVSPVRARFSLKELQAAVGGYIEFINLSHTGAEEIMVVNEEGALQNLPPNKIASLIACRPIVGDVLVAPKELLR